MARLHHHGFAKRLMLSHAVRSPDKMFEELRGPQREAFLMFLWQEAASAADVPLPHVGVGRHSASSPDEVHKLSVVGALDRDGVEVIVISMPPALEPNEAFYLALTRRAGEVRVYFYERCMDDGEAVLASAADLSSRINHGFFPGVTLQDFKRVLGDELGISLDGLETSLPEITIEDFIRAGGGRDHGSSQQATHEMTWLERLLLVRAALPVGLYAGFYVVPFLLYPISFLIPMIYTGLSLVLGIMMLIWLHNKFSQYTGQTKYSPGMAVGAWFIPIANFFLPALVMRDLWRTTRGDQEQIVPIMWWACWLLEICFQFARAMRVGVVTDHGVGQTFLYVMDNVALSWSGGMGQLFGTAYWLGGMASAAFAYGGLYYIVRQVNAASR